MTKYDVIIIGAGLNGLTTAAYLGKAGLKTLVLERRDVIVKCVEMGVPIFNGRIDKTLFLSNLREFSTAEYEAQPAGA